MEKEIQRINDAKATIADYLDVHEFSIMTPHFEIENISHGTVDLPTIEAQDIFEEYDEDAIDNEIADEVMRRVRAGKERLYSEKELRKLLHE